MLQSGYMDDWDLGIARLYSFGFFSPRPVRTHAPTPTLHRNGATDVAGLVRRWGGMGYKRLGNATRRLGDRLVVFIDSETAK